MTTGWPPGLLQDDDRKLSCWFASRPDALYQIRKNMNLNQSKLAEGLVNELLELIHKYDETMVLPTVLGCLDLVKQQLILDHTEDDYDE